MKYMGSKRSMLENGLGELLTIEIPKAKRFIDLFAGSGAVSIYVARTFDISVHAVDLQTYTSVITGAVLSRTSAVDADELWNEWLDTASKMLPLEIPDENTLTQKVVKSYREWAQRQTNLPITRAYAGHYFSPFQATWIDALLKSAPKSEPERSCALSALIQSASQCVASPGHTAQPFQPTRTAKQYLAESWNRDVQQRTKSSLVRICSQFSQKKGFSHIGNANEFAASLVPGDLVFIDPPYSGVHYSRFYHVLESIALGGLGDVTGAGRYPDRRFRPRSDYSMRSRSEPAVNELFERIAARGASAIVTFPDHLCSNGLSGKIIRKLAAQYFVVRETHVHSKFSTLGGPRLESKSQGRGARQKAKELILVLRNK